MRLAIDARILAALLLAAAFPQGAVAQGKPVDDLSLDDLPLDPLPAAKKKKPAKPKPAPEASKKSRREVSPPADAPSQAGSSPFIAAPPTPEDPSLPAAPLVPAPPPTSAPLATPAAPRAPPPAAAPAVPEPPLLKLVAQFGVSFLRSGLVDEATAAEIESGLRGIASLSPISQKPLVLQPGAVPCAAEDDGCFVGLGARQGLDEVMVATVARVDNALLLRVRRIDVAAKKSTAEARLPGLSGERTELKAAAEALLCKLIVPAGCIGELLVATGGAELAVDGKLLPRGEGNPERAERVKLPVGLHALRAKLGKTAGPERMVAVLREEQTGPPWSIKIDAGGLPVLVAPGERAPAAAPGAAVSTAAPRDPGEPTHWTRLAGYGAAGAGALALAIGGVQGARSSSKLSDSEAAYKKNGGAYTRGDLANLQSANSAASSANLLFVVGGVLAVAGAALVLAF